MKNLTPEIIENAKNAKNAEELLEIAKANNLEMTADEAATYFAQLNPKSGELDDDALDSVAGGGTGGCNKNIISEDEWRTYTDSIPCPTCGAVGSYYTSDGMEFGQDFNGDWTCRCNNCKSTFKTYRSENHSVMHPYSE